MVDQTDVLREDPKKKLKADQVLLELDTKVQNIKSSSGYLSAYVLSVLLPPIGIYYFFKYLFFAKDTRGDAKAGFICLFLTMAGIAVGIWTTMLLFSQVGSITGSQGGDLLKELITPANQKELKDLFR